MGCGASRSGDAIIPHSLRSKNDSAGQDTLQKQISPNSAQIDEVLKHNVQSSGGQSQNQVVFASQPMQIQASTTQSQVKNDFIEKEKLDDKQEDIDRIAQEQSNQQRLQREQSETESINKGQQEKERIAKEQAEKESKAKEQADQDRIAKEQAEKEKAAKEQAEKEMIAKDLAEKERLAKEQAEKDRLDKEMTAKDLAEKERFAKEQAAKEKSAKEQAEKERIAKEKADKERIAKEQAEKERLAKEQAAKEKAAKDQAEKDRLAKEKADKERIAKEQAEKERLAKEQAAKEKAAKDSAEKERLAKEKADKERIVKEQAEKERLVREQAAKEKAAKEQAEKERIAQEKVEKEKIAKEQAEKERLAKEQAAKEKAAKEQAEKERLAQEKADKERIAKEQAEKERLAKEQGKLDQAAKQQSEKERIAKEKADKEKATKGKEQQPKGPVLKNCCPQKHQLIPGNVDCTCNVCSNSIKLKNLGYRCGQCDWDVCKDCIVNKKCPTTEKCVGEVDKYCPRNHQMVMGQYTIQCDICKEKCGSEQYYHCERCKIDFCFSCESKYKGDFPEDPPTSHPVFCNMGHLLYKHQISNSNNQCEVCRAGAKRGDWACRDCYYGLCNTCYERASVMKNQNIKGPVCNKGHALQKGKSVFGVCKRCPRDISSKNWGCEECNYALCTPCYEHFGTELKKQNKMKRRKRFGRVVCPMRHGLIPSTQSQSQQCFKCKATNIKPPFECDYCKKYICQSCYDKDAKLPKCLMKHALGKVADYKDKSCTQCKNPAGLGCFSKSCDYYLCQTCYDNQNSGKHSLVCVHDFKQKEMTSHYLFCMTCGNSYNEKAMACSKCDFSFCLGCFPKVIETPKLELKCCNDPFHHSMKIKQSDKECLSCRIKGVEKQFNACEDCDFRICQKCIDEFSKTGYPLEKRFLDIEVELPKLFWMTFPDKWRRGLIDYDPTLRPIFARLYTKILEIMSNQVKPAINKDHDTLVHIAEVEKRFSKIAYFRYQAEGMDVWQDFKDMASKKGLIMNLAIMKFNEFLKTSSNKKEFFNAAEMDTPDLTQNACAFLPLWHHMSKPAKQIHDFAVQYLYDATEALQQLFGSKMMVAPIKNYERIYQKMKEDDKTPSTILDYIRGSMIVDTPEELKQVIDELFKISKENRQFKIKRLKNGFKGFLTGKPGPEDYPRIIMNVMLQKTMVIEIQIAFSMVKQFAKVDHAFYEIGRQRNAHGPSWGAYDAEEGARKYGDDQEETEVEDVNDDNLALPQEEVKQGEENQLTQCPDGHTLQPGRKKGKYCNLCSSKISKKNLGKSCPRCDWDICKGCLKGEKQGQEDQEEQEEHDDPVEGAGLNFLNDYE